MWKVRKKKKFCKFADLRFAELICGLPTFGLSAVARLLADGGHIDEYLFQSVLYCMS